MLLPHGILEISIYILLGAYTSVYMDREDRRLKKLLFRAGKLYLMLLFSAMIEAWVTPRIVRTYIGTFPS